MKATLINLRPDMAGQTYLSCSKLGKRSIASVPLPRPFRDMRQPFKFLGQNSAPTCHLEGFWSWKHKPADISGQSAMRTTRYCSPPPSRASAISPSPRAPTGSSPSSSQAGFSSCAHCCRDVVSYFGTPLNFRSLADTGRFAASRSTWLQSNLTIPATPQSAWRSCLCITQTPLWATIHHLFNLFS
jgi:hypothetical protein